MSGHDMIEEREGMVRVFDDHGSLHRVDDEFTHRQGTWICRVYSDTHGWVYIELGAWDIKCDPPMGFNPMMPKRFIVLDRTYWMINKRTKRRIDLCQDYEGDNNVLVQTFVQAHERTARRFYYG